MKDTLRVRSSTHPDTDVLVDIVRRFIRVLGAQPAHASNPLWNKAAAHVVAGRFQRAGVPVREYQGVHGTPLIVAGNGPVGIITYLDDNHPLALEHTGQPPVIGDGIVRGPGIERKAGAIAAMAPLLVDPTLARAITVLVETDRNSGSQTLEGWLATDAHGLRAAIWEAGDLPLHSPVAIRSSTGTAIVEIKLRSNYKDIEPVFGAVLPDLGVALAGLLASLKTGDQEVRLEGFYDNVDTPGEDEFATLMAIAPGVKRWIRANDNDERSLSTAHMTLGLFCAPSIVVRDMSMRDAGAYLPSEASAIVELQLMPGQSADQVIQALGSHARTTPFDAQVNALLVRPPVGIQEEVGLPADIPQIPIAPGLSPAALLRQHAIPAIGYAVVDRRRDRDEAGLSIDAITNGSRFIMNLVKHLHDRSVDPA